MATKAKPSTENISQKVKKGKLSVLDGLVTDLYQKVEKPLGIHEACKRDHLEDIQAIHRILTQVQKYEKPLLNKDLDIKTGAAWRTKALKNFLRENDFALDEIQFDENSTTSTSFLAKKAFSKDEKICAIPRNLIMTTFDALKSPEIGLLAVKDKWLREIPSLILTLFLLFEKNRPSDSPSKWKSYIDSLPGQNSLNAATADDPEDCVLPLSFKMDTIEALQGTTAVSEYQKILRTVAKQYCHVRTVLRQLASASPSLQRATAWFSFAQFRWAVWMVMSRQTVIALEMEKQLISVLALVPVFDSFKKQEGEISWQFSLEKESFEVFSNRQYAANEPVSVSFGSRPNTMLLLNFGFLADNNPHDKLRIVVDLDEKDPLYHEKVKILGWLKIFPTCQLDLLSDGSPSKELAQWLHISAMEDSKQLEKELREAIAAKAKQTAMALQSQENGEGEDAEAKRKKYLEMVQSLASKVTIGGAEGSHEEKTGEQTLDDPSPVLGVKIGAKESTVLLKLLEDRLLKLSLTDNVRERKGSSMEYALAVKLRENEIAMVERGIALSKKLLI